jgi:hypothetical protein
MKDKPSKNLSRCIRDEIKEINHNWKKGILDEADLRTIFKRLESNSCCLNCQLRLTQEMISPKKLFNKLKLTFNGAKQTLDKHRAKKGKLLKVRGAGAKPVRTRGV